MRPVCFVLLGAIACGGGREPPDTSSAAPLTVRDAASEVDAAAAAAPAPVWTPFARRDDVPICLFARYEDWGADAQYLRDAKQKVTLKAGAPLYFGAYGPGCADPECVRKVTLQCWADVEGKSITVNTRYSGERQLEHACTDNCQAHTAACETPPLPAGKYTLKHGAQQRTIRVPGVVDPACLPEQ